MPRYNQQEARTSPRQRKLEELSALAQLSNTLGEAGTNQQALATREHQGRVAAAMEMLGLMQQQQNAQQQQAFREQELAQQGKYQQGQLDLQQKGLDNEMLARAGGQSNEAAQRGIMLAQQQTAAEREAKAKLAQDVLTGASSNIFTPEFVSRFFEQNFPQEFGAPSQALTKERAANVPGPEQYTPEALKKKAQGVQSEPSIFAGSPLDVTGNVGTIAAALRDYVPTISGPSLPQAQFSTQLPQQQLTPEVRNQLMQFLQQSQQPQKPSGLVRTY